jgi:diaminohydroxyphosphoribosylaminopyrimidine deaminase/5-amino-6-(5-phosphoribosylamino)uracil reductase
MARLPLDSALVGSLDQAPLLVVCSDRAPSDRIEALRAAGAEPVVVSGRDGRARAVAALEELGRREIQDVMVEGGPTLAGALFDAGEIDSLRLFMAPLVVGAGDARALLEGEGSRRIADSLRPLAVEHEAVGEDLLISARLREW